MNAAGIIITIYLQREITSDGKPLLSPSRAPQEVTDTADTTKPALIILKAVAPSFTVCEIKIKSEIILDGITKQITVPTAIIVAIIIAILIVLSLMTIIKIIKHHQIILTMN